MRLDVKVISAILLCWSDVVWLIPLLLYRDSYSLGRNGSRASISILQNHGLILYDSLPQLARTDFGQILTTLYSGM